MPKISIIVPVYRVEPYLERCVESILAQTYHDFELILVDDGSPDNCGTICDAFAKRDSRVRVIHKENGGLSSARNSGLDIALGDYIGFVDSDDWVTNDMFEYLLNMIEENDCDISSVSYVLTNGTSNFKQPPIEIKLYEGIESLRYYLQEGMSKRIADYPVWIKLYKKELFDDLRFPRGQLFEDGATNFILLQKAKRYIKSNKIAYFYFQDGTSITRGGFKEKDFDILIVGNQLVELAMSIEDHNIINLAKMKQARSYFSLLSKIAVYGFANNVSNKEEIISNLTKELRANYSILIKSPMPINRKIIMSLICIHINLLRFPISIYKRYKDINSKST